MTRCVRQTIYLASASANNAALSQTPTAAAGFTLNGALATAGVVTFDVQRRVLLTTAGDESAKTVTFVGTDGQGNAITEVLTPSTGAGTAYTKLDFKTLTSATPSADFGAAATLGTNGIASTAWVPMDSNRVGAAWSLGIVLPTGVTANVMPQATLDALLPGEMGIWLGQRTDPWTIPQPFDLQASALTATQLVYGGFPVHAVRLLINSGATTAPGVYFDVVQQGNI